MSQFLCEEFDMIFVQRDSMQALGLDYKWLRSRSFMLTTASWKKRGGREENEDA